MNVKFFPCGDRALTMEFGNTIDPAINTAVLFLERSLAEKPVKGIVETVPTYCSLLVHYDPMQISDRELIMRMKERLSEPLPAEEDARLWEVPCCYGLYFGKDRERVEKHTGLPFPEIVERHCAVDYRIYMLGFLPGFVYLGGMDPALATPRLETPRLEIPRGAVGIGGNQTGIYPIPSPGGWNLIGSTPLELFDGNRTEPSLFRAGDHIRFFPVSNGEYYEIRREVLNGTYRPSMHKIGGTAE